MRPCACICHRGLLWHAVNEFCCINAVHVEQKAPAAGEHEPYIDDRHGGYRAICACGWRTDPLPLRRDAELEIDGHKRKTAPRTEPSIWDQKESHG